MIEAKEVIQRAMEFPMDQVVGRYSKEEGLPLTAAKEHERELKRYLLLCALNPSQHYGMRGPIDKLWHTFLVFTKDYARFSKEVAGHFLHHDPVVEGEIRNGASLSDYLRTLSDYESVFGEEAPRHIWPRPRLPLVGEGFDVAAACCNDSCGSKCSGTNCENG